MLHAERHRPRGVGLAGTVHRTWAVAEKNDLQFSNPRIDTALMRMTPLPGCSTVSGDSPEDSSISGATTCMF